MKKLYFTIFIAVLILIQFGFFSNAEIHNVVPNLFLLGIVYFSLRRPLRDSFLLATVGGIFLDLYSGVYFGANLIALWMVLLILHFLTTNVFPKGQNDILLVGLTIFSTLIYELVVFLFLFSLSSLNVQFNLDWNRFNAEFILCQTGYNLLLCLPLVFFARRNFKII